MVAPSKKTSFKHTERKEVLHEIPSKSGIISVIGADTCLGEHMLKQLCEAGKTVYGFSQRKDFKFSLKPFSVYEVPGLGFPPHPILSDWLVVCIDPTIDEYGFLPGFSCDLTNHSPRMNRVRFSPRSGQFKNP